MIELRPWNGEAQRCLAVSGGRDLPVIARQVKEGVAQLWECESERSHAWVVTRVDADEAGVEWCIVLFEGSGLHEFVPHFVDAARARGIPLRAHLRADRPGLLRMVRKYGFGPTEIVVRARHEQ